MVAGAWHLHFLSGDETDPTGDRSLGHLSADDFPVAMILCDQHGQLLRWTPLVQEILGDSLIAGLPDAMATLLMAAGVPNAHGLLVDSLEESQQLVIRRGGREQVIHLASRPVGQGHRLHILTDHTPSHPEAQDQAHLQSLIAHDLRSPLAVIQGYAGLLATGQPGPLTSTQQEFLAGIDTKILEVSRLLDDFLDLSRLAAGGLELQLQSTPVGDLLAQIIEEQQPVAELRQISLDIRHHPEPITVQADPLRLHQIMNNLIGNAIKYNLQGGWVTVSTRRSPDGEMVNLDVADGGLGMDSEVCSRVFEPYQRGRDAQGVKGVGLGLVVVKKLVELHGGSISVVSEAGKGTCFTVSIPVGKPVKTDQPTPLEQHS